MEAVIQVFVSGVPAGNGFNWHKTWIDYITSDLKRANMEIVAARERERKLNQQLSQMVIIEELHLNG